MTYAAASDNASRPSQGAAPQEGRGPRRFASIAWGVLGYNLLVIVWGAFVRATGSGAGCGAHWPLCNGEVIPRAPRLQTLVELSHRLTSGLALVFVAALVVAARRALPPGAPARKAAWASLGFVLAEAAIGAALVLFELVAHDASMKRALSMSLHLVNTFFLLAALSLTAFWAREGERPAIRTRGLGPIAAALAVPIVGMLVLGTSGAVTALGDTLFPARSLGEGLAQDLSPGAHLFLRLRVLHPLIALVVGGCVAAAAAYARVARPLPAVRRFARVVTALVVAQIVAGVLNVVLLAPVAMQLVHLLLADAIWIYVVLLSAAALSPRGGDELLHRAGVEERAGA